LDRLAIMNKILLPIIGVIIALAAACSAATPVPTATTVPTVSMPTPMPIQEWKLEGVKVDGNTVTVLVRVYARADVDVTLSGASPNRVDTSNQVLEFIYDDVATGEHSVVISDVAGFRETASVAVSEYMPTWLTEWLAELDSGKADFPPQSITEYEYNGATVYYVVKQCCDQFSDLLDADGNLIGHPDGGIAGRGDGVTVFPAFDLDGTKIWTAP